MKELKKPEVCGMEITSDTWSGKACVLTLELKPKLAGSIQEAETSPSS